MLVINKNRVFFGIGGGGESDDPARLSDFEAKQVELQNAIHNEPNVSKKAMLERELSELIEAKVGTSRPRKSGGTPPHTPRQRTGDGPATLFSSTPGGRPGAAGDEAAPDPSLTGSSSVNSRRGSESSSGFDSDAEDSGSQLVAANTKEDQEAALQSLVADAIDVFGRDQAGLTRRPSIGRDAPFEATTKKLEELSLNDPKLHRALDEVDSLEETRYGLVSAVSRKEDGGKNQGMLYVDESLVGGEDVAKEEALKALSILQAVVKQYNSKLEHGKDKITAERLAKMTLFADRNNGFGKVLAQIADDGDGITYQRDDADGSIKRRDCYVADFMKVKNLEDKKSDIVINDQLDNDQLDFRLAAIAQLILDDKEKSSMVEALTRYKASDSNYVPPAEDDSELIKQLSELVTNQYANDAEQSFVQQRRDLEAQVDRLNKEIKEQNKQIEKLNVDFRTADKDGRLKFKRQIIQMKQEVRNKNTEIERFKGKIDEEQKKIAGQLTEAHDQESTWIGKVNLILQKERDLYEEYENHKEKWKFSDEEIEFSAILQHVQKKLGIYSSQNKEYQDREHDFRFNNKKLWGGKIADILAAIFPNEDWKSIDDEKVNELIVFFGKVIDGKLNEIDIEVQASDLELLELDPAETDTQQPQIEMGSRSPYSGLGVEPAHGGVIVGESGARPHEEAKRMRGEINEAAEGLGTLQTAASQFVPEGGELPVVRGGGSADDLYGQGFAGDDEGLQLKEVEARVEEKIQLRGDDQFFHQTVFDEKSKKDRTPIVRELIQNFPSEGDDPKFNALAFALAKKAIEKGQDSKDHTPLLSIIENATRGKKITSDNLVQKLGAVYDKYKLDDAEYSASILGLTKEFQLSPSKSVTNARGIGTGPGPEKRNRGSGS